MTKAERERLIEWGLQWMMEEPDKFPGWAIDPKIERVLLDSILTIYPEIRLVAVLAAFRMHWYPHGAAKPHIWRRRLQNWVKAGAEWDPMITGVSRGTRDDGGRTREEGRGTRDEGRGRPFRRPVVPSSSRPSGEPVAVGDVVKAELAKMRRLTEDP
jgi:hypothetical protein